MTPERTALIELAHYRMPFGKFKGRFLDQLPESYLLWFRTKGFPEGKLGLMMRQALEIRENGLESLMTETRKHFPPDTR